MPMQLIIKDGNLTMSMDFIDSFDHNVTAEEVLLGAYDLISRAFSQEAVVRAYYHTNPDTMDLRDEDDGFLKHVKFFGYDERKEP